MLFQNKLGIEDIAGCYKLTNTQNNEEVYLKFDSNSNISFACFDIKETVQFYTIENADMNSMTINYNEQIVVIKRKDDGSLSMNFDNKEAALQKISAEEYKNDVAFAAKLYDKAISIYGEEMAFFDKAVTINNTNYYVYNTEEGDESTGIYIDSSANVYVNHGNGLVPYGTEDTESSPEDDNSLEDNPTFSEDMALQYARSYCSNNYGMNDSIDLIIGDSGIEEGMQYYRIKLVDTYAASQGAAEAWDGLRFMRMGLWQKTKKYN